MEEKLLNIFNNDKNSHQINSYCIRGDTIDFENDTGIKHKQNTQFFSRGRGKIEAILEEMLHKQIIRETTHKSRDFVSPIFIVKKPDGGTKFFY